MSSPPLATRAILIAALPALLREWAIFPPSSLEAARVWKVLTLDGRVGDDRDEPYSTAILFRQLPSIDSDDLTDKACPRSARGLALPVTGRWTCSFNHAPRPLAAEYCLVSLIHPASGLNSLQVAS